MYIYFVYKFLTINTTTVCKYVCYQQNKLLLHTQS